MHLNYYFLRQLTKQLNEQLVGYESGSCFSQNKDELLIGLSSGNQEFYIKAQLTTAFSTLSFPEGFNRARSNSVSLFKPLIGKKITGLTQHQNERSFQINFEDDLVLLFKLFGNRSNLILFDKGEAVEIFHNKFEKDWLLKPETMGRTLDFSYEAFVAQNGNLPKLYPTLGELPLLYLAEKNYPDLPILERWNLVQETVRQLEQPQFYITRIAGQYRLSLLALGEVETVLTNPIEALNYFVRRYFSTTAFEKGFHQAHTTLQKKLASLERYVQEVQEKLAALQHDRSYAERAELIMANLYLIPAGAEQIEVLNYYTNQQQVIPLKKDEAPQKTAEKLYRKAKNQHLEIEQLQQKLTHKTEEIERLTEAQLALEEVKNLADLKQFQKDYLTELETEKNAPESPFRVFETEGFKILVGKSAANNDLLTQKYSYKEDLWLHAKDVTGSHVVIKFQAGKKFPESVIEKAAQLAAWYSKRKNDSLCPVLYTPKKYVRKPKGAEPGAVVVEREKVLLVKPGNPF